MLYLRPVTKNRSIKKYLQIALFSSTLFSAADLEAQSKDSLYDYIISCGIKHPEVVIQQALLETGHLGSAYLMKRNNLFAFRVTEEYMSFENWQRSVEYYKRWQDKHYTNHKEDYYSFLQRMHYSAATDYIRVLKKVRFKRTQVPRYELLAAE